MRTGELNRTITISQKSESTTDGDVVESWSTPANVRAKVIQIDGTRFLSEEELIDKALYKIETWYGGWSDNIKIVFEGKTLTPIRPITVTDSLKSKMNECIIYATCKR